ncbi:pseudouridine-5'-phosphate glycosidase, partial [Escherichia coli]|nr:pseudouridine-5'-phosphate glycosidase [Escherichia coli]
GTAIIVGKKGQRVWTGGGDEAALARVAELTGGDSLKSNIQLVFNNAILASEIAKEYQRLAG